MHLIPASWSHFHMLVAVFPSVGLIFAVNPFYAAAAPPAPKRFSLLFYSYVPDILERRDPFRAALLSVYRASFCTSANITTGV